MPRTAPGASRRCAGLTGLRPTGAEEQILGQSKASPQEETHLLSRLTACGRDARLRRLVRNEDGVQVVLLELLGYLARVAGVGALEAFLLVRA